MSLSNHQQKEDVATLNMLGDNIVNAYRLGLLPLQLLDFLPLKLVVEHPLQLLELLPL
jgi:hypothetical protein